ncbi:hypothetical protein JAAARDRAFT_60676 [Jaapia argillacea MUCL 33604]|uniref:Uncharacterized protein n=1 Tax=Jaapia argillacea MUCL 33604 TaxID=933084 RepID=A0A067PK83_9AGAM|nr:hypothetical protein JAAARDRAFT_60676 [Jaapia argillacea MUCL 33604]
MSSNSSDCSSFPTPNPDVSGIGVRISFYAQAFLLALVSARSSSPDEITNALTTLIATNMAYCVTTMTLGFANGSQNQLSLYDALVVLYLLIPSSTAIFFTMPTYNRLKKGSRLVKLLAVLQSYLVFTCSFVVLTLAPTFGSNSPCNDHHNFVIFRPFRVLHNGRTAFLVLLSCVIVGYTAMLVSDCGHRIGIFMKAARAGKWGVEGDEEKGRRRRNKKGGKLGEMKPGAATAGSGEGGDTGGAADGDGIGLASEGVGSGDATTGSVGGEAGDTGSQATAGDGQTTTTIPSQPSPLQQASNPPPSPPTPIPILVSPNSSRSSPGHLELTLFNSNSYSPRVSFEDSTANQSTISLDKETSTSDPGFGDGAYQPRRAGIDPMSGSFVAGGKVPVDSPYQVNVSGRLIVNIFLITMVSLLAIVNTELLRKYNHPQPADKSWGFGQILPVFLVILPLTSAYSAFKEHGLGVRKRKERKILVRTRKSGAAGTGMGKGANHLNSATLLGAPPLHLRPPTTGGGAEAGGSFFGGAGANPSTLAFGGAPFSGTATGTTNAAGTITMFVTGAVIEEVSEMGLGRPKGDDYEYEVYEVDSDDDEELSGPEEAELNSHGIQ